MPSYFEEARRAAEIAAGKAPQARTAQSTPVVRCIPVSEFLDAPPESWRVKGLFPDCGLAGIYGPSSCGKSFLALDMAYAIARGIPWFERRTKPCAVVYLAAEGERGFRKRMRAYLLHNGLQHTELPIEVIPQTVDLLYPGSKWIDETIAAIHTAEQRVGPVRTLFVDTLNRTMPGGNENDPADMSQYVKNIDELRRRLDGLIVVIHHTPKNPTSNTAVRPRGHGSFFAALDAALEVERTGNTESRSWTLAKSRDDRDGDQRSFKLEQEVVGLDPDDGEPRTSCFVIPTDTPAQDPQEAVLHPKDLRAFNALAPLANGSFAHISAWLQKCQELAIIPTDASPDAADRQMRRIAKHLLNASLIIKGGRGLYRCAAANGH